MSTTEARPTARPWTVKGMASAPLIVGADGYEVAEFGMSDQARADAEHIVRAVNAFEWFLLVASLVADEGCPDGGDCGECLGCCARQALALARGEG